MATVLCWRPRGVKHGRDAGPWRVVWACGAWASRARFRKKKRAEAECDIWPPCSRAAMRLQRFSICYANVPVQPTWPIARTKPHAVHSIMYVHT